MSRSSRIATNVASNWTGFAVNAAVALVLTPIILRELGEARYGIWILTSSIIGYYGILDLGFRAGVNQFLTRSLAVPDFERASNVISTAFVALSLLGIGMAGISVVAASLVPRIFDLPTNTEQEAFWCILIIGMTAAIQCFLSPFSAVFVAKQRFDLSNLISVSTRLLTAIGIFIALKRGYGLIGISLATGIGAILDYVIRWIVACRLVPALQVSRHRSNLAQLREIGSFGIWNFLITVSDFIFLHVQPLLIAAFMPIAAVGHYALAAGLWYQINALFLPVGQVLYPSAAELDVRGETDLTKRLYSDGTRFMLLIVWPIVMIAFFWSEDFYRLWIGEQYLSGDPFTSVASLLRIMLIATALGYVSNVAAQILLGAGHIRSLSLLKIFGAAITLGLSLILIENYGLVGIAASIVVSAILADFVGITLVLQRKMALHCMLFIRPTWIRLTAIGLLLGTAFHGIRHMGPADTWLALIMHGALAGICTLIAVLSVGITTKERHRFLLLPAQSFITKMTRRSTASEK